MTHQDCAQAYLMFTWFKFIDIYPDLKRFLMPKIVLNKRLTKTGARCFYDLNKIDLSYKLFEQNMNYYRDQLIPHEVAHQIDYNYNGHTKGSHHGTEWKRIMIAYGIEPLLYHPLEIK